MNRRMFAARKFNHVAIAPSMMIMLLAACNLTHFNKDLRGPQPASSILAGINVTETAAVSEDGAVDIEVVSASALESRGLRLASIESATHGVAIIVQSKIHFEPTPYYSGEATISYTVADKANNEASAAVTITVHHVNHHPEANDDSVDLNEDSSASFAVLGNDRDVDSGDVISVAHLTQPGHGSATALESGEIRYTPELLYEGPDSFSYEISDGQGGTSTAEVAVTVHHVNHVPVAAADSVIVNEDSSIDIDMLANDTDADAATVLVVSLVSAATHGSAVLNSDDTVTYTPAPLFHGQDSFSYEISDGNGATASGTVFITVDHVNHAPSAVADVASVDENGSVDIEVLANDTDPDQDTLSIASIVGATNGVASIVGSHIHFVPTARFFGAATVTYSVSDGHGGTSSASAAITVVPDPTPPTGFAASLTSDTLSRRTTATVSVTCTSTASYWMASPIQPAVSADWQTCPTSVAFSGSIALADGANIPKIWFMSHSQVVATSAITLANINKIDAVELVDPTPGTNESGPGSGSGFSQTVYALANGNILAGDKLDTTHGANSGAWHLFNGQTGALITSIYGGSAGDQYGTYGATVLTNGNVVLRSPPATVNGIVSAGIVMLVNPSTGAIVATLSGDNASDQLGSGSINDMKNGNFLIRSPLDDVASVTDAGSAMLVNGSTGAVIATIAGDNTSDQLGSSNSGLLSVIGGIYPIRSPNDDVGGVTDAGSVKLLNATTGAVLASISGDNASDRFGYTSPLQLSNGNIVIQSTYDTVGGLASAGSIKLIDGSSFAVIGTLSGDDASDNLGSSRMTDLKNGNFVVTSGLDDVGGLSNAGSVMLVNGTTTAVIATFSGATASDAFGASGTLVLPNGNFAVWSTAVDVAGKIDAGSLIFVNGLTGTVLLTLQGSTAGDKVGYSGVNLLTNGNFIVRSVYTTVGANANSGSVTLVDGTTGAIISTLTGTSVGYQLGWSGVTLLSNSNYVVRQEWAAEGGISNSGSAFLVNGTTGAVIGSYHGDTASDQFASGSITDLKNGYFVIASPYVDKPGIQDAGTITLINATTGAIVSTLVGNQWRDMMGLNSVTALPSGNYIVSTQSDDNGGTNGGSVILINGTTGAVISTLHGHGDWDNFGDAAPIVLPNGNYVVSAKYASVNGITEAGSVNLINGSTGALIASFHGLTTTDNMGDGGITVTTGSRFLVRTYTYDNHGFVDSGHMILVPGDND